MRFLVFFASLFILGFGHTIYTHGVPRISLELWKQIKIGDDTERVVHRLGLPTLVSKFDNNRWYYISYKIKQANFLGRRKYSSKSILVLFDNNGKITEIKKINVQERRLVDYQSELSHGKNR